METTLMVIFIGLSLILWFWALIDISKSRFKMPYGNTLWLFIIILFPVLGVLTYFLAKRKITTKVKRKFNPNFNHS